MANLSSMPIYNFGVVAVVLLKEGVGYSIPIVTKILCNDRLID